MSRQSFMVGLVALGLVLAPGWLGAQKPAAGPEKSFDGDLAADLAIGVPLYDGAVVDMGVTNVLYGTWSQGLTTAGNQMWGLATPSESDLYGYAVAVGDFNNDGFADLASGIPYGDFDGLANAGAVHFVLGSSAGLAAPGSVVLTAGYEEEEAGAQLGFALAVGDFDGDGFDDLAASAPFRDWEAADVGMVYVFYDWGWGIFGPVEWFTEGFGLPETPEVGDRVGHSLAAGDFNGDGYDDLAVGVPFEDVGASTDAGALIVGYSDQYGVSTGWKQLWYEDQITGGTIEAGDEFGYALAAGDFDGDGYDDLAVSAPGKKVYWIFIDRLRVGVVYVLRGSPTGLTNQGSQVWFQYSLGDDPETDDQFGFALAAGDLNCDRYADLAIGVPYEDLGSPDPVDAGCVHAVYGSAIGLVVAGSQMWTQDTGTIQGIAEANDVFGFALAVGDFNADGCGDLAVGAPGEMTGSSSGAVHVVNGSITWLTPDGNQLWIQEEASSYGVGGGYFGFSVAAEARSRAFIFADDFESGGFLVWSSAVW